MSNCWKCGRELPEGQVECESGECGVPEETSVERVIEALRSQGQPIVWSKVTCFADLVKIMSVFYAEVRVMPHTPAWNQLRKFMPEPTKPGSTEETR
jgi:hypothetical protein